MDERCELCGYLVATIRDGVPLCGPCADEHDATVANPLYDPETGSALRRRDN